MITKYIKADITTTELKYIAHGTNCQNAMGSGVAKALYTKFPLVKELYHNYAGQYYYLSEVNKKELLGEVQSVHQDGKVIYNCFTQFNYGYDKKKYISYVALVDVFKKLVDTIPEGEILAIPKIGAGLAGGNWEIIEELINEVTNDKLEVWVYEI